MIDKIKDRLAEPSSYGGAALVAYGIEKVFKAKEAGQVAEVLQGAADAVTVAPDGNGLVIGLTSLLFGLVSMFMPERGRK